MPESTDDENPQPPKKYLSFTLYRETDDYSETVHLDYTPQARKLEGSMTVSTLAGDETKHFTKTGFSFHHLNGSFEADYDRDFSGDYGYFDFGQGNYNSSYEVTLSSSGRYEKGDEQGGGSESTYGHGAFEYFEEGSEWSNGVLTLTRYLDGVPYGPPQTLDCPLPPFTNNLIEDITHELIYDGTYAQDFPTNALVSLALDNLPALSSPENFQTFAGGGEWGYWQSAESITCIDPDTPFTGATVASFDIDGSETGVTISRGRYRLIANPPAPHPDRPPVVRYVEKTTYEADPEHPHLALKSWTVGTGATQTDFNALAIGPGMGATDGASAAQGSKGVELLLPVDITVRKKNEADAPPTGLVVKKGEVITFDINGPAPASAFPLPANTVKWKTKQLKSDGTYTDWADVPGEGRS